MSRTVVIVPGFRGEVADHWQTLLAAELARKAHAVLTVPALGRDNLTLHGRMSALSDTLAGTSGEVVLVAHSGGVIHLVKWVELMLMQAGGGGTLSLSRIRGALLATPADFGTPMPEGYPSLQALDAAGWLPVPRVRLPFPSVVAASHNDPLASFDFATAMAKAWGSRVHDLREVGHLNPASGFGPWPEAESLINSF